MPAAPAAVTPGLSSFLRSLKGTPVDSSTEHLISLLKRRQIRNSRPCAIATTQLLFRVVAEFKGRDPEKLISRIREVGQRLTAAQPREMVVGNIIRRVLGLVREVVEDGDDADIATAADAESHARSQAHNDSLHRPTLSSSISTLSPLKHGATMPMDQELQQQDGTQTPVSDISQRPPLHPTSTSMAGSLFGLFSSDVPSVSSTPTGHQSPRQGSAGSPGLSALGGSVTKKEDLKAEVLEGIRELLDELDQVDEQIAAYALEHIHSNEIILTHSASATVQRFLLTAAKKRKFTVIHAEAYPNGHNDTHATVLTGHAKDGDEEAEADERFRPLTAAGITVILIPDSAVFAIMSRVNKVILATHSVLANGGLVAAAGARMIAQAAKVHQTPVVVVSGVYKLSPVYPFDHEELIEYGDAGGVVRYEDGEFVDHVDVVNPLYDFVPPELVDLYITNLGGHAPSYLYRIVADHYRVEDINL